MPAHGMIAVRSTLDIMKGEDDAMARITIRNLEDDLKRRLRFRAAENGRPMEEAREILRHAREAMRDPPSFGGKPA